jgi:hypothetical protein
MDKFIIVMSIGCLTKARMAAAHMAAQAGKNV